MVENEIWNLYEPFVISLIIGGLVGLEREYKKQTEGTPSFGGVRTFMLISLLGTLSVKFNQNFIYLFPMCFLTVVGFLLTAQFIKNSPHLTSSLSAVLTFILGALCGLREYLLSAFLCVTVLFVLSFKEQLHGLAKHLTIEDFYAFLKFATVTVIAYPLLPDKNFYGINPKEVWTMVAIISTIDFIGYVLTKFAGEKGIVLTGLIGGLVSSTAVTVTFSPLAKINRTFLNEYAAGIVGASAIMFPRMTFLSAIVNVEFAKFLLIPSAVAFLGGIFFAYRLTKKESEKAKIEVKNPYELSTALKFGLFYAFILFASKNALRIFGDFGLYVVSAVSGLSDVDAITLSTAKLFSLGNISVISGTAAVLIAAGVNTIFKWFLTLSMGNRELFKKVTPGFVGLIAGELAGILIVKLLK